MATRQGIKNLLFIINSCLFVFVYSMVVYQSRDASTDGSSVAKRSRFDNAAEFTFMKLDDIVNWARAVCTMYLYMYMFFVVHRIRCGR